MILPIWVFSLARATKDKESDFLQLEHITVKQHSRNIKRGEKNLIMMT
jgi:thioredoxin-related protein